MKEGTPLKKKLTPGQAKAKAENYCAFQERSQQEVRDKLYQWGLYQSDIETIISSLIEEGFLNEERFARAYVRGKFHLKSWGKIKIKQGLKLKYVSEPLIRIALNSEIDADAYYARLEELLKKKNQLLHETDAFKRKAKLANFALTKGYENQLIWEVLDNINN